MVDSADGWSLVQRFMLRACGVVMSDEQRYLLDARLGPVAKQHGFVTVRAFVDAACAERPGEPYARSLVDAMTTHETFFFRDAAFWRAFDTLVLPRLLTRERSAPVRVWSAACSTGQEAYSVAMTFAERSPTALDALELVATDVAEPSLERAREGVFSALEVGRGLGAERLSRHFDPHEGGYRIKERLRRAVRWEVHNLLGATSYPPRQDVVLCRNVLIYFGDRDRAEVVRRLFDAAAPGAFVGVGSTEVIKGRAIAPGWFVRES
jgi:chemotaxis protein methyltransferase CheR